MPLPVVCTLRLGNEAPAPVLSLSENDKQPFFIAMIQIK